MAKHAILVADDDEGIRLMLSSVLEHAGYAVKTAVDGGKAARMLETESFDLLLTDIVMPEKDGPQLIIEARRRLPKLAIVAMSGGGVMTREEYLKVARMLGANAAIEKPFTGEELLGTVGKLLARTEA